MSNEGTPAGTVHLRENRISSFSLDLALTLYVVGPEDRLLILTRVLEVAFSTWSGSMAATQLVT